MIKIDLHIHTVASVSDASFEFSEDRLKEYISTREVNCIAITNHNLFDRDQFINIQKALPITVLPGIEIDLDGGQILLIADGTDLDEFDARCLTVSTACPTNQSSITIDEFKSIFPDFSKYILIPHYEKKPKVSEQTLEQLKPHVTAGEVTNPKKFMYCLKDEGRLVPVYFSDYRSSLGTSSFPIRQTYLSCSDASFSAIKSCLRDKAKVSLTPNEGKYNFPIFEDGQELSSGLNVVMGERSTGKSYTLNLICKQFPNSRHIEQFSLVERDEEADKEKFNKILAENHSLSSQEYLNELQSVVQDVINIDIEDDSRRVDRYLNSLLKHANEAERQDSFSKAKLYGEEKFEPLTLQGLKELIDSTKNLIKNEEFKSIIEKHISIASLTKLYVELMQEFGRKEQERQKKVWLNELISEIKDKLQIKSAVTKIEDINLYNVAMNLNKIVKFNRVVLSARKSRRIVQRSLKGFEIVANVREFEGAGELKTLSRLQRAFKEAFQQYQNPYAFLQQLKLIEGLEKADYHKFFAKIDFKILNRDGFEVSGGERSEFNLLLELQEAKKYDMLLIDEPESSFDNLFLKQDVNEYIKDISKDTPVVLVTHNSTVGASIKPDYLLYTKKELVNGNIQYRIYSGCPTDKVLYSRSGQSVKTRNVTMDCLEAGEDTYEQRRQGYEDIRD